MADIDKSLPNQIRTELEIPGKQEEVELQEDLVKKVAARVAKRLLKKR